MRWAVILLLLTGTAMARPDPKDLARALMAAEHAVEGSPSNPLDSKGARTVTPVQIPYWQLPEWALPEDVRQFMRRQKNPPIFQERDSRPVG
jgi:HD-like signal output (HDOD) protein